MCTVGFGYFITHTQITPLTALIWGVREEEKPVVRILCGGQGVGGGQNLHIPPEFRGSCFNTTQLWKLGARGGQ